MILNQDILINYLRLTLGGDHARLGAQFSVCKLKR